ncbi:hypothetical protein GOP47_0021616 [Adiantum capillus-veneris]|uniref:DRBM domain-containing protein n=1 Tax=Adiantum capillus-veneris TaxID=13818 RepID=A0A9D4Z6E9_ADICA|nr:hypothetical protein GOP47_0021616 [Adiantum capillus-veneris]
MHKNQLQELAQRSNANLPAYSCIREGPDHAPRFKATVNFNGELFESPEFFSTLRQAEHAAAEVALNLLSKRGPSQFLAAKVLDETGICKNLLQETAQRAGVSLPVYTTIRGMEGHALIFSCIVEVGGRAFAGEPAKSKKQAEKNAAMAAWSSFKQLTEPPWSTDCKGSSTSEKFDSGSSRARVLAPHKRDGRGHILSRFHGGRSRVRMVNVRERNRANRELSSVEQFLQREGSLSSSPASEGTYESQRFLFSQKPRVTSSDLSWSGNSHQRSDLEGCLALPPFTEKSYDSQRSMFNLTSSDLARSGGSSHQRSHSLTGLAFDSSTLLPCEALGSSGGSTSRGGYLGKAPLPQQHQPRASRLSLQSTSDRIELRQPLVEEFQLQGRHGDPDWFSALGGTPSTNVHSQQYDQQYLSANMLLPIRRAQSERFELKPSLFDELYRRDEEEWWSRGEKLLLERGRVAACNAHGDMSKYRFYEVGKGCFETISHKSGYSNEQGSYGTSYNRRYSDANSLYTGSSPYYYDPCSTPVAFSTDSQGVDRGASSDSFNVDTTSFFSNEALERTFSSSHCNPASSGNRNVHDTEATTSSFTLGWPHSPQWSSSRPLSRSTVAHPWGFSTSSLSPPVRIRQTVAVCSAPPPQSLSVESNAVNNMGNPSLQYVSTSIDHSRDDVGLASSTRDNLQQLRLE